MSSFKTKSFYDTELYYYYLLHKIVCADKVIDFALYTVNEVKTYLQ